jgi:hypothetical protein
VTPGEIEAACAAEPYSSPSWWRGTLGRLQHARKMLRVPTRTRSARARLIFHDFIRHGLLNRGHQRCEDCGRRTGAWRTDDVIWDAVMGSDRGILCEPCFAVRRAEA